MLISLADLIGGPKGLGQPKGLCGRFLSLTDLRREPDRQ